MAACRNNEGLIAASIYGDLTQSEQATLDQHLAACEGCKAEFHALRAMTGQIPVEPVIMTGDLRPALIARIREEGRTRFQGAPWRRHFARLVLPAAAAALAVVFVFDQFAGREAAMPPVAAPSISPIQASLDEATVLAAEGNYTGAYLTLAEGIDAAPNAERAAEALQRMGEIALTDLRWYPEAYEAYHRLRQEHFTNFTAAEQNKWRLEMLTEARGPAADFAALHALDQARNANQFEAYESVAARYTGTTIASLAATEMARLAGDDATAPSAMEQALARCTNAAAAGQLKFELAVLLSNDAEQRSKILLQEVVDQSEGLLAQRAQSTLDRLQ